MKKRFIFFVVASVLLLGIVIGAAVAPGTFKTPVDEIGLYSYVPSEIADILESEISEDNENSEAKTSPDQNSDAPDHTQVIQTEPPAETPQRTLQPEPIQTPVPTQQPEPTRTPELTAPPTQDATDRSYEEQEVDLVNEERAAYGLGTLTLSAELSDVARMKSQDMHDDNYFSHTSPTYGALLDMLKSFGITYSAAGENIAMGYATPEAVVTAWMNSEGHKANILNSAYTQIGVGYVDDGSYWTQEFIG